MGYIQIIECVGILAFALSGGLQALKHHLDVIGVIVLAMATGVGGGIVRDCLLGDVPPAVFRNEVWFVLCAAGGLVVFWAAPRVRSHWPLVLGADAVGLGVFAAAGAAKAMAFGVTGPIGVALIAVLTAVGGGVIRDVLVSEIPAVLHTGFYATAALLGALVYYMLVTVGGGQEVAFSVAAVVTTGSRFVALRARFNLPKSPHRPG